jgi:hypothetical protein
MDGKTCKDCGNDKTLYRGWRMDDPDFYCWTCYHKHVIDDNLPIFGNGIVGDNSGWIDQHTLAGAIAFALEETDGNIDRGVTIDADIGGSYEASAIVRCGQLFVPVASLWDYYDLEPDEQHQFIEGVIARVLKMGGVWSHEDSAETTIED